MKNITTNLKKQTLTFILILMLALSSFVSLLSFVTLSKKELFADSGYKTISISNSNFNSNSGTELSEPNSFTAVGSKGSTTSGVIDVDPNTFDESKEEYKLSYNPSKPKVSQDNKILMINNQNLRSSYGYESSSFTLEKNKFYYVSCFVYTQNNDISSTASLYLTNSTFDALESAKIENISTRGNWKEYRYYVKTNNESQTVKLALFIGAKNSYTSAGAVFFDNINAFELTEQQYYNEINNTNVSSKKITLTDKDVTVSNGILNGDFEDSTLDFSKETTSGESTVNNVSKVVGIGNGYFDSEDSKVSIDPTDANRKDNHKALLINNYNPIYTGFVSNNILIERQKLYKLTIDVKTSSFNEGGASLKLVQQNPYDEKYNFTPANASFSSVSTSDKSNSLTNDWIAYTFLIKGNAFKDSYANLTLALEKNAVGYVFFDNIKLFEITNTEYENSSSDTNSKTVDFSAFSGSPTITNGAFNNINFETTDETSPYKAESWTTSGDSNTKNYSGIIEQYNGYDNVFVMANKESGYQSVTSQTFSMSASTLDETKYYVIQFDINTNEIIFNGANVVVTDSNNAMIAKLSGINTDGIWKTIKLFVKTSTNDLTAKIRVELGSEAKQEKGYVYVDNFELESSSQDAFEKATSSSTTFKSDLSKTDFAFRTENANTASSFIYSADNFTGTKNSTLPAEVEAGIMNINACPTVDVASTNDYVLVIHNIQDAYYSLKSNSYSISSGNFYKIQARVRTYNLKQDVANKQLDEKGNEIKLGAKISLSGIDAEVSSIEENDNFTTYTFFVSATTDTSIAFNLSLGDENALVSGYAFFDNLSFEQINEDDFKKAKENKAEEDLTVTIVGDTNAKEDEQTEEESAGINFDWLLVPSLILGIALLIAMVGLLVRKINFKKPVKAQVKDYDRAKTLVKEHEKREKMKQRESRLAELREKLQQIENEIEQNKNEYKNSKSLKEEIKVEHTKISAHIKQTYQDINSKEAQSEEKKLKLEAKAKIKQLRKERFETKRKELIEKYLEVEKEIDAILEEERLLVEQWKAFKKQQKIEKKEKKINKKNK
ncbi:MAG: hypothetical protein ACI4TI_01530 [Christensenellales bacterium]